jgi:DNA-binding transcriptional regulator YdaS (Cro superfamily)
MGTRIAPMLLKAWVDAKLGRGAALARHLKVPPSMVSKMANGKMPIPLEQCPFIQDFTEDQVTCEELRPDKAEYFAKVKEITSRTLAAARAMSNAGQGAMASAQPG